MKAIMKKSRMLVIAIAVLGFIYFTGTQASADEILIWDDRTLETENLELAFADGTPQNLYYVNDFLDHNAMLDAFKTAIMKETGNIELYRRLAESSVVMDGPDPKAIDLFRKGFYHFLLNTNDMEGVTRLGIFLGGQSRSKYPSSAMRIYQTMIAKTEGQKLTTVQRERIKYAKSWIKSYRK